MDNDLVHRTPGRGRLVDDCGMAIARNALTNRQSAIGNQK